MDKRTPQQIREEIESVVEPRWERFASFVGRHGKTAAIVIMVLAVGVLIQMCTGR